MTSAAAMVVEIGKVVESTILTVPPDNCVALILDMAKEKAFGTWPCGSETAVASEDGTAGEATSDTVTGYRSLHSHTSGENI